MTQHHALLPLAIAACVATLVSGCDLPGAKKTDAATPASSAIAPVAAPANETVDQFVARVNAEYKAIYPTLTAAQWLSSTYINGDSELLSAKENERFLAQLNSWIEQSKKFEGQPMSADSARAIMLLKLSTAMPPPRDPAKLAELTRIATRMEGMYGAGSYCTGEGDARKCEDLGQLSEILAKNRDYDEQLRAWQGWHTISQPMKQDYVRFAELVNQGARDMGFADAGEIWRSGYDMPASQIGAESDRLWGQVKPLYEQLHCYARTRLVAKYGKDKGEVAGGMLPAHLMGNMWQQDWGNLWDILQPYPGAGSLDITSTLEAQARKRHADLLARHAGSPTAEELVDIDREAQLETAKAITRSAESFYTGLGMPKLPQSYWENSQFIKPRDRDVVCHASAWDMNTEGDVRTKMCIKPNEEEFTTIYHELGHVYYYLAYNKLPPVFQAGAHDGFHEAIGDTIVLSMTPKYLQSIGLLGDQQQTQESLINSQMRMALAKVAFLPFGLMIDRWRWGVFDGSIKPDGYNKAWWDLKAQYQGVAPASPRGEQFFDAGAKYHVPGNTPYTRYFLSHILQFQFYKALCDASGFKGPLYECSFAGNAEAGRRFQAMLAKGASQPWPQTLKELTGGDKMDGSAVLEYFAPLQAWLKEQNAGQQCGWSVGATSAAAPARAAAPSSQAAATPRQG